MTDQPPESPVDNPAQKPPAADEHQPHERDAIVSDSTNRHHEDVVMPGAEEPDVEPPYTGH